VVLRFISETFQSKQAGQKTKNRQSGGFFDGIKKN
jgi:hypothetical protein